MSNTASMLDDRLDTLPLPDLLTALDSLGVTFRREKDALALRGGRVLTAELREAITEHKPSLLTLCDLRADLDKQHQRLIRLRCEDPPKGTRAAALVWLSKQIEKLAVRSVEVGGTADGWPDPDDVFADNDQIEVLRESLAEVEGGPYPVPPPDACCLLPQANFNPFAYGRLLNGKLAA